MLTVGIHKGLRLGAETKVKKSDKGTSLEIVFEEGGSDLLSKFEANEEGDNLGGTLMLFTVNVKKFDKTTKSAGFVGDEIMKLRAQLRKFMEIYAPKDAVEQVIGGVKIFEGIGLDPEKYKAMLLNLNKQKIADKITINVFEIFAKFISEQDLSKEINIKFSRRSKDSHYATIPHSGLFVESADKDELKWEEWEIKSGKNDPTPSLSDKKAKRKKDAESLYKGDDDMAEDDEDTGGLMD